MTDLPPTCGATAQHCPGCPAPIPGDDIACQPCRRRLPADLRSTLRLARRRSHTDRETYLDALRETRQWFAAHRKDQP
jgi:hypothetical protein